MIANTAINKSGMFPATDLAFPLLSNLALKNGPMDGRHGAVKLVVRGLPASNGHKQPGAGADTPVSGRFFFKPAMAPAANISGTEKLAEAEIFRSYQRAFEKATGLPLTLRAVESWQLARSGSRPQNDFYQLLTQSNRSLVALLQMQQSICDQAKSAPCTRAYPFGLVETAVAVKAGQEIIAYLMTGRVFLQTPTSRQTHCAGQMVKKWNLGKSEAAALLCYRKIPVWNRTTYMAAVKLLEIFAVQLGETANRILIQQQTTEPFQITRARQFIEEHYHEKVSLAAISRQAGMCTFYFSKKFKQVTGLNFTDYVSRVRVEQAKKLLLNHNYRVSEVGYEVGFQSLTHFNRKFKKIAGYTPKDFRKHLPAL